MSTNKRIQSEYRVEMLPDPAGLHDSTINPELHEINFKTSKFTVDGDIVILGDTIVKDFIEVSILDAVLTLNSNHDEDTGNQLVYKIPPRPEPDGPLVGGLQINRGTVWDPLLGGQPDPEDYPGAEWRTNVNINYNDTDANKLGGIGDIGQWTATDNGFDYYPLNTPIVLEKDENPHLGGHLIVNGYKITTVETINEPDDIPPGNTSDVIIEAERDIILRADIDNLDSYTGQVKVDNPLSVKIRTTDPVADDSGEFNKLYAKVPAGGGTGLYVKNDLINDELVSRSKAIVFGLIF